MAISWSLGLTSLRCSALVTMLYIQFSGGMGVSYRGEVDLSALPDEVLARTQTLLSQRNLASLSEKTTLLEGGAVPSGSVVYEFKLGTDSPVFRVSEDQASEEFLELLDELRDYLVLTRE